MASIILTGGGTAGHITPSIALFGRLHKQFDECHYIGSDGMEKELLKNYPDIIYHEIDCAKLRRSLSPKNLTIPFHVAKGMAQARKLIKQIRPSVIFSKGGYVSVPVLLACPKSVPIVSHESDLTMGLANRLTIKKVTTVCTTFPETAKAPNAVFTGTPIREELFKGDRLRAVSRYGIGATKPVLLIIGGSLGSQTLNALVEAALPDLLRTYDVLHIAGKNNPSSIAYPGYVRLDFCLDIADLFALADIVLTRGGANVIHELAALKKPMLIVPLPKSASRGDQLDNADNFASRGIAHTIRQEALNAAVLTHALNNVRLHANDLIRAMTRENMSGGAERVFHEIVKATQSVIVLDAK